MSDIHSTPLDQTPRTSTCRLGRWLAVLWLALLAAGCGDPNGVQVKLASRTPPGKDFLRLAIEAQVTGPLEGLHYKWFSVSGSCDPQESEAPGTLFKFAENIPKDRVTVELWRQGRRVARSELDVTLNEERIRMESIRPSAATITITQIPPYEPYGGNETRAEIAGRVEGASDADLKVVLYARVADTWYVQPVVDASLTLLSDNTWSSWTHTGSSYAALAVRPGYALAARLDLLPPVGGYVVARTVVDGRK